MQGVPHYERVGYLVLDELRKIRSKYGIGTILPSIGWILGHTGYSVERRQFGTGTGNKSLISLSLRENITYNRVE